MSELRPLTDDELRDARVRAAHTAERWGYTLWLRLLARCDTLVAEVEQLRTEVDHLRDRGTAAIIVDELNRLRKIEAAALDIESWVLANHLLSPGDIAHLRVALHPQEQRDE